MEGEKHTYFLPNDGSSTYDMCICASDCKKDCLRNKKRIQPDKDGVRYITMSYLGVECTDYEPDDEKTD